MSEPGASPVSVERLMRELKRDTSDDRRARLLERGGSADYRDPEVFADVEALLRRILERHDRNALLLPELVDVPDAYTLQMRLRYESHRAIVGPLLIFLKRRLLLPINRWLYEYSLENFRRQQRVNRLFFACIEELAIENARLKKEIRRKTEGTDQHGETEKRRN